MTDSEVAARRVYRNFHVVPAEMEKNEALVAAQKALVAELSGLREALNADEEFSLYKTMVGRDSIRPDGWDDSAFDHKAIEAWRAERFAEIAGQAAPAAQPARMSLHSAAVPCSASQVPASCRPQRWLPTEWKVRQFQGRGGSNVPGGPVAEVPIVERDGSNRWKKCR